ncbi:MAG: glycosyltransferase family 39 protein [Bacteroidetes bacterium]|nr:MAG: glycosyltransferase family 39 protein [Bacteroidota bacterium]
MAATHCPKLDETLPTHPNHITLKRTGFYILLVALHLALFWQVKDFPFLGDSIPSNLFAAENIYNHHFGTVWNIPEADPGHGTLYPAFIALMWLIFGKSLWVTHLVQIVVGLATCLIGYKIARKNWGESTSQFAVLLFSISPLYVGQLIGASLQLPLTLAALSAFYFWQQKKHLAYAISLCLMMLCHLQAAFLLLFLFIHDAAFFYIENGYKLYLRWFFMRWWIYALPFAVFLIWGILHQQHSGWAFSSPNYLREAPSFKGLVYNIGIMGWRVIDFGYLIPFAVVIAFIIKRRKKIYLGDAKVQALISYVLMLLIVGGGICIVFAHPPIHRYFLPTTLLLLILFAAILEEMKPLSAKIWATVAAIALVAGNFMYYPGKCMGDANLAYLPLFKLEEKIAADFPKNTVFYTYAPLSYPSSIRYMDSAKGPVFKGLYNKPLDSATYVLQSCMNCEFSAREKEILKTWHGTSYTAGNVFVNIYANPAKVPQKPKGWQLRQPSAAEIWLQDAKENLQ